MPDTHPPCQVRANTTRRRVLVFGTSALVALALMVVDVAGQSLPGQLSGQWVTGRGCHYFINSTMMRAAEYQFLSYDAATPGTYSSAQVADELDLLASLGVDNVRVFGSYWGWRAARSDYEANLADFLALCHARDIAVTYVIWSTTGDSQPQLFDPNDLSSEPAEGSALYAVIDLLSRSFINQFIGPGTAADLHAEQKPWFMSWRADPGNALVPAPPAWFSADATAYLHAVADSFIAEPFVPVTFDLFNEPDADTLTTAGAPLDGTTIDFIAWTQDRIEERYAGLLIEPEFTVGFAYGEDLHMHLTPLLNDVELSFVAVHAYGDLPLFEQELDDALVETTAAGLPLVVSEFYAPYYSPAVAFGTLDDYLAELDARGLSGQIWGLLDSNALSPSGGYVDGIVRTKPRGQGPTVSEWLDLWDDWPSTWSAVYAHSLLRTDFPVNPSPYWDDLQAFLNW